MHAMGSAGHRVHGQVHGWDAEDVEARSRPLLLLLGEDAKGGDERQEQESEQRNRAPADDTRGGCSGQGLRRRHREGQRTRGAPPVSLAIETQSEPTLLRRRRAAEV